jgi:peroxidase
MNKIKDSTGVEIDCPCGSTDPSCMSYSVPVNDTVFKTSCMKFTRSSASFSSLNCTQSYREQLNIYTSFIDGSAIYGNSLDKSKTLRTLSGGNTFVN